MADNSSLKRRNVRIAIAACVCVLAVGTLLRGFLFSPASSRDKLGLSSLSTTDENGDKWVLDLAKGQSLSTIKGSDRKPGPPLLIKTDVRISGRNASVGLVIEGQAGEKYAGGAKKNRRWQPPPQFTIVDESGKTLVSGAFKYG
ncbi:MAG: hypothetical protein ACYS8I_09335 [Planctomycetota bacterium]|jgi:hypothetical protein